jgi:hypothetical protein
MESLETDVRLLPIFGMRDKLLYRMSTRPLSILSSVEPRRDRPDGRADVPLSSLTV